MSHCNPSGSDAAPRAASNLIICSAALGAVFLTACASRPGKPAPMPAATPAPPPRAVVAPAVVSTWVIPGTVPSTRYVTEISATIERDSAGRVLQERVETRGVIVLQVRRDTLGGVRASGVVDSFTIRGLENVLSPPAQIDSRTGKTIPVMPVAPLSVPFDAVLDSRSLRVATRPPLANECDRPETGATNLVRELLVRVPKTVSVGAAWRDSTVSFMCRLNVPITTRTKSDYMVERVEQVQNRTELVVKRVAVTQLDGTVKSSWRNVTLSGAGRTMQTVRVDAATGIVRSIEGEGLLTVKLTDTSRRDASGTQEMRQKTTSRTIVRP